MGRDIEHSHRCGEWLTDDVKAALVGWWADGMSQGEITKKVDPTLGRNVIGGYISRNPHLFPPRAIPETAPSDRQLAKRRVVSVELSDARCDEIQATASGVGVIFPGGFGARVTRPNGLCQWPMWGDAGAPNNHFCSARAVDRLYCAQHTIEAGKNKEVADNAG